MSIKFEDKYIKNKLKNKFGQIEIYNSQYDKKVYSQLIKIIETNSKQIQLENGQSDIEVVNTIQIMRFMIINLTNIEDKDYWNNIDDTKLEEMLNLSDGDFKKAVNSLLDIMIEVGQDIAIENIRKLNILNNKLNEMTESIMANMEIDKTLSIIGLDRNKMMKLQNGDEETIKEFQTNLIKQIDKPKRGRPKKKK
jgi:hypothetical protein